MIGFSASGTLKNNAKIITWNSQLSLAFLKTGSRWLWKSANANFTLYRVWQKK